MSEPVTDAEVRYLYRLCEAALMQAVASLEHACTTKDSYMQRKDALDWIFASDSKNAFCFDNVCEMLGYEGAELRDQIEQQCMSEEEKGIWL